MRNLILLTGRAGSKSVPGKNIYPVLGRPLGYYPMQAALDSRKADDIYISTDCPDLQQLATSMGIRVINRPAALARDNSELVDAITHAMNIIGEDIRLLITMHCNCGVHLKGLVDTCIDRLLEDPTADSCVTGSIDRSAHPFRTRRVTADGYLVPWMEMPEDTSSNRQNLDGCVILDGAVRVMRVDRCFPPSGPPPFHYLGQRVLHVENIAGGDVHSMGDIHQTEYLLRQLGWTEPTP